MEWNGLNKAKHNACYRKNEWWDNKNKAPYQINPNDPAFNLFKPLA